jgi:hypothetical protein
MCNIFQDLRFQRIGGGPLYLSPQAEEEFKIQGSVVQEIDWFEIQNVGLDAEAYAFERGAIADVRDSLKATVAHCEPRNVDARAGKQTLIWRKIDCRNEKLCAYTSAFRRIRVHTEDAA